jgi:PAS domain S-box-containing protein
VVIFSVLTGVVLFLYNIAALAKNYSERSLRMQEKLQSRLFATLSEGVLLCNPDGTIVAANQRASGIVGWNARSLVGSNIRTVFPKLISEEDVPPPLGWPLDGALAKGRAENGLVFGHVTRDGEPLWLSFNSQPVVLEESSKPFAVLFSFSDISDQVSARKELLLKRAQLVEASRLSKLGEMAGGIAHEINNPLTVMNCVAAQLEAASDTAAIEQSQARAFAAKIYKTVDDVTVGQMIGTVTDFLGDKIERKGATLEIGAHDAEARFKCRFVQVSQVLINLVNNALDAVLELDDRWIRIEIVDQGQTIKFRVVDSGKGISAELRERIMQPFFTTKPIGKGTGLGLSISQTIAEAHGGSLIIDSECPNTCFVLEIPKIPKAANPAGASGSQTMPDNLKAA